MLITPQQDKRNKIVILNPKGGCGKSTLVTNLAAFYAEHGKVPAIMDYDPQGSSTAWLERRPDHLPKIHGIVANKKSMQAKRLVLTSGKKPLTQSKAARNGKSTVLLELLRRLKVCQ